MGMYPTWISTLLSCEYHIAVTEDVCIKELSIFLTYRKHRRVPGNRLVPQNKPTVPWALSGGHYKAYFLSKVHIFNIQRIDSTALWGNYTEVPLNTTSWQTFSAAFASSKHILGKTQLTGNILNVSMYLQTTIKHNYRGLCFIFNKHS